MDAQPATRVTTTMGSTWCIVFYDEPPVSASQTVCCTSKLAGPYAEGGDTCVGMMLPASSPAYAARQAQLATFASRLVQPLLRTRFSCRLHQSEYRLK